MYPADTAFTVSAFSFCLFGFFWKPTEHISILSVTLWGDLTAVSTAAFSFASKSLLFAVPKVRDIIRQACLPPHAAGHTGRLAVLHELHRSFTSRVTMPEPLFTEVPISRLSSPARVAAFADLHIFIARQFQGSWRTAVTADEFIARHRDLTFWCVEYSVVKRLENFFSLVYGKMSTFLQPFYFLSSISL